MATSEDVARREGYEAAVKDAVELLMEYSDADGEVTEGRGIIERIKKMPGYFVDRCHVCQALQTHQESSDDKP